MGGLDIVVVVKSGSTTLGADKPNIGGADNVIGGADRTPYWHDIICHVDGMTYYVERELNGRWENFSAEELKKDLSQWVVTKLSKHFHDPEVKLTPPKYPKNSENNK